MAEIQVTKDMGQENLISEIAELAKNGYSLVQIGCTKLDCFEINYSFDKEYAFVNLRIRVPLADPVIESISSVYWGAFIYENEINDLFGVMVKNMVIDYNGTLYRTKIKWPFSVSEDRCKVNTGPETDTGGKKDG